MEPRLDPTILESCLGKLETSLSYLDSELGAETGLREVFTLAAIRNFHFAFLATFKTVKQAVAMSVSPETRVEFWTFSRVIDQAHRNGLVADPARFERLRKVSDRLTDDFSSQKLEGFAAEFPGFVREGRAILAKLVAESPDPETGAAF